MKKYIPFVMIFWILSVGASQPEVVKLEFTWVSMLAFLVLLIIIVWTFLRFKRKS